MKKIIYTLLLLVPLAGNAHGTEELNYEVTPLHNDEINRSSLYGAEIGNGAVLGADSIFCEDANEFEACYASVQRTLARGKREADKLAVNKQYSEARSTLVFAMRESAKNLSINFSSNRGDLLGYLARGVDLDKTFNGLCLSTMEIDVAKRCYKLEAEAAYSFLNSYFSVLLDNAYMLDLQFLVPLHKNICKLGGDSTDLFKMQLDNYTQEQVQLLRIILGYPVNGESSGVNFYKPYYQVKLAGKLFEYISEDLQKSTLGKFLNISVSNMVGLAEEIRGSVKAGNIDIGAELGDEVRDVATRVILDLESVKYRDSSYRVNCNTINQR
ncbi:MAG: hypothetical protein KDD37_02935 [Bdellovibrionales bacterium]|nr:hypothetical protein [Bdellovibrionales bacterium]